MKLPRLFRRGPRAALPPGHSGFESGDSLSGSSLSGWGMSSNAGPKVSAQTIMQLSAVWACTSRTAQLIASLPGSIYQKEGNGRAAVDSQLADILTVSPNHEQTSVEFWEGLIVQTLMQGNGLAEKISFGRRGVVGLEPLPTGRPQRMPNGKLRYEITDRGKREYLPPEKVFHIRGFGSGTGIGLSAVRYGVQSFGSALAADETAQSVFGNGLQPGGYIRWDSGQNAPSAEQRNRLQELLTKFSGSKNTGKMLELPPGASIDALTFNPEDAQLLETRRFSIEDICRWFGVPPIIIGHSADGQTMWGSGVEAIMLSWLTLGINPLLRKIEWRIRKDLISPTDRRRHYFEFNREAMLQMDSAAKGEFMSKMGASGTMTANERRAKLNLPRSSDPNADRLLAQTALAPLSDLGGTEE